MREFSDKVAVITGGADGIGKALVVALARSGMRIVILDIRMEAARATAAEIVTAGGDALAFACDVTLAASVAAAADAVRRDVGSVSLLCVNAGVGAAGGIITAKQNTIDWVLSVNQKAVVDTLRAFRPLLDGGTGPRHVLVTASSASLSSPDSPAQALYAGSKHCTIGIAEAAAAELAADGIGTTILCPGLINTRIWDGARARPDHFGGPRHQPEQAGENWRRNGMDVDWVAACALDAIAMRERYCVPVEAHNVARFEARIAAIRAGYRMWEDRDRRKWPEVGAP